MRLQGAGQGRERQGPAGAWRCRLHPTLAFSVQVGSPHTWPSLLAALTWIVELLAYQDKAEAARQVGGRWEASGGGAVGRAVELWGHPA